MLKELKTRTGLTSSLFHKVKRHLENNLKSENNISEQDELLNDLPQQLRNQIIQCTHGDIKERIDFFKDKEYEFLFKVMPELKPLQLLTGDVLYLQSDHADTIYMIKSGQITLLRDISEFILQDENQSVYLSTFQEAEEINPEVNSKNLHFPIIKYLEGSYFGDCDSLVPGQRNHERDSTAVADVQCQFFVLARDFLMGLKRTFGKEIKEMESLARKRRKQHDKLIDILRQKVQIIQKEKPPKFIGDRDFFEINLMNM